MPDDIERALLEQIEYYRARAPEYDQWWFREGRYDRDHNDAWLADISEAAAALNLFRPTGRVLELACGTGIWTERLVRYADHITALDASPEVLALNAQRVGSTAVQYIQADLFEWQPTDAFDVVFFSFWLTHVPAERFETFWDLVARCLKPGGRVFFVDSRREPTSTAADHSLPEVSSSIATRRLNDGREFRIYKVFYDPEELATHLALLGWRVEVKETARYFIYGAGQRHAIK
jgi:demethylmenaquinone methyltransferase/2-methoxy-6-polyprenyl-1,4-benzoquinol methylase